MLKSVQIKLKTNSNLLDSKVVTGRLDSLLNGESKIMSKQLLTMLEGLKSELEKRSVRKNVKMLTLIRKYRLTAGERERSAIRCHILPTLGKLTVAQVNVDDFVISHKNKPESSAKKILKCFERIMQLHEPTFTLPKIKYPNKGRQWTPEDILEESEVVNVIENYVMEKYRLPCYISAYSGLRLKNVMELKRSNIDFKGNWINVRQSKTKKFLQIPIGGKLKNALNKIKVWPVNDDFIFCGLNSSDKVRKAVSNQVARSFQRAGLKGHSFHSLRHFFACYAINRDIGLETVRDLLGHSDFRSTLIYAKVKRDKLQQAVMEVFK